MIPDHTTSSKESKFSAETIEEVSNNINDNRKKDQYSLKKVLTKIQQRKRYEVQPKNMLKIIIPPVLEGILI